MSKMISVASGFQYSVNIGYDLNNDNKLKNFIPTKSALSLLEEVLMSTNETSTERSRILIGAYGKGKSHIMLMILSMLMKKDITLFEKTLPKIAENPKLQQLVENYYEGNNRILPVVITGSNTSLSQAFTYEEIYIYDEDEWNIVGNIGSRYPAFWLPNDKFSAYSFYGTENEALAGLVAEAEYNIYF